MARLSARSFTAVASFMAMGILSGTVGSPTFPLSPKLRGTVDSLDEYLPTEMTVAIVAVIVSLVAGAAMAGILRKGPEEASKDEKDIITNNRRKIIPSMISAILFSLGLVISKMTWLSKIYGFLNMKGFKTGTWDPTLLCVMGGGFLVSFLSYQFVKGFNVIKVCGGLTFY